jgi:CheY-like chemotaxis protein
MSLKIMVADDEALSLKVMRSLTASLGHTVLTFEDRQQAAERAEKQRFDVVFLGMHLPELEGLELARRIRNSPTNHETTIVMLNDTDDTDSLRKAFGEGANFVLTKPVKAADLLPMLAAMQSPGWKRKRGAARLPLTAEVTCKRGDQEYRLRSRNLSESGMLMEPSVDVEIGGEVSMKFNIAEVGVSLDVRARIVRKEGTERVAVEFIGLTPEERNAIQLYVMGHMLKKQPPPEAGQRSIWLGRGFLGRP